jgi:septal ring factor EnvC (AmiA/AmiB activator)
MISFIKPTLLAATLLGGVGLTVFGSDTLSVVDTAMDGFRDGAKDALSLEFRLEMVENDLQSAEGEVAKQISRIAELSVERDELDTDISKLQGRLNDARTSLAGLTEAYEATGNGQRPTLVRGFEVLPKEVADQLRVAGTKVRELKRAIEMKSAVLETRDRTLPQLRNHLSDLRSRRDEIALGLEGSRADLECVRIMNEPMLPEQPATHLLEAERRLGMIGHEISVLQMSVELSSNPILLTATGIDKTGDALIAESRELLMSLDGTR